MYPVCHGRAISIGVSTSAHRAVRGQSTTRPRAMYCDKAIPGNAVDDRFTHGRDRSRVMDVGAQVAAGVDPGEDPGRPRSQVMKCEPNTIGRCSGHRHAAIGRPSDDDRAMGRHTVATPGNGPAWGDDLASAQPGRRLPQGGQTGRIPAVVIGQDQVGFGS